MLAQISYDPTDDKFSNSDRDVAEYTKNIAAGKKFATIDDSKKAEVKQAQQEMDSPYFLALDQEEVTKTKNLAYLDEKQQVQVKSDDNDEVDVTEMV